MLSAERAKQQSPGPQGKGEKGSDMNKNFNIFAENVVTEIAQRLPEAQVELRTVTKNNGIELTGLTIRLSDETVTPNVYLESFYKESEGVITDSLIDKIIAVSESHRVDNMSLDFLKDYDNIKSGLRVRLINTESNKSLLDNVPHKAFMDLSMIAYYQFDSNSQFGNASFIIRNQQIKLWDQVPSRVLSDALNNTYSSRKAIIRSMFEVLTETFDFPEDFSDLDNDMMYVARTSDLFGANVMLYMSDLKCFARSIDSDLYVIPSSIHEVILVPVKKAPTESALTQMVNEVNGSEVSPEEVLSDHVYYFSMDSGYRF